jgi:hypothetical protein
MLAFAVLLMTATPTLSLDEVIAKNLAARGGADRLRAIKTLRVKGHTEGGWATFEVTTTYARALKMRNDTAMQGMVESSAVDGKQGWQTNAFSGRKDAVAMSPDDLTFALEDADFEGPLVDWQKKGHKLELLGTEDVDGSPAYKIKATLKSGTVEYLFLDADAFIEIKTVTQRKVRGTLVETETEYGNYEKVNGIYFPFSIESRARRSQNSSRFAVDSVETDVPVDDAMFAKPSAPGGAK